MEKQMFGKQMLAETSLTVGHREDFDQLVHARFLPVCPTLVHVKLELSVMIAPFLGQVLYPNSFSQSEWSSKTLLGLSFLKNKQLKINNIPTDIVWGVKLCLPLVVQLCAITKNDWIVGCEWVICKVCELQIIFLKKSNLLCSTM